MWKTFLISINLTICIAVITQNSWLRHGIFKDLAYRNELSLQSSRIDDKISDEPKIRREKFYDTSPYYYNNTSMLQVNSAIRNFIERDEYNVSDTATL
jgi:hypothetical protein